GSTRSSRIPSPHASDRRSDSLKSRRPRRTAAPAPASPRPLAAPSVVLHSLRAILIGLPVVLAIDPLQSGIAQHGALGFPMDDPYIHFQFARNFASGAGFSFNPGVPTPGATSPLWVVLLAAGRPLGAPLESLAIVLGLASAALATVMTFEVGMACGLPVTLAFG